jgi:glutaredoxin 3
VLTVVIFTRRWCGYCDRAEQLLRQKGITYDKRDLTGDDAARAQLAVETGRTTVPQVFINGRSIGGYDDLAALDRLGELDRLIAASAVD